MTLDDGRVLSVERDDDLECIRIAWGTGDQRVKLLLTFDAAAALTGRLLECLDLEHDSRANLEKTFLDAIESLITEKGP